MLQVFSFKRLFILLLTISLFVAFYINLEQRPLIEDEAIRGVVAMEMDYSGNYIVPTTNGKYYYNKPPLYNWILLGWMKMWGGNMDTWILRTCNLFFLFCFGWITYIFGKNNFSREDSALLAFMVMTCGRILVHDSRLGLIDICYSAVTFGSFMLFYFNWEKNKPTLAYIGLYLLSAIGFMLKGLPSFVFLGLTILTLAWFYKKDWQRFIFHQGQFIGAGLFVGIIVLYYWTYHQYHDVGILLETLFSESSKRTASQHGIGATIVHLFTFPFEYIYHFLPWTVLFLYLFDMDCIKDLWQRRFFRYITILFLVQIAVYWLSVEVYPRYLFMHIPLSFIIFLMAHNWHKKRNTKHTKVVNYFLFIFILIIGLLGLMPFVYAPVRDLTSAWVVKSLGLFLAGIAVAYAIKSKPSYSLWGLVAGLIVFRLGFNWFVIPIQTANSYSSITRASAISIAQKYKDIPLYVFKGSYLDRSSSFYIESIKGCTLPYKSPMENDDYFFVIPSFYSDDILEYTSVDSLKINTEKQTVILGSNLTKYIRCDDPSE